MFVVETVSQRNVYFVPAIIARLVATYQQYRRTPGIECIERPEQSPEALSYARDGSH